MAFNIGDSVVFLKLSEVTSPPTPYETELRSGMKGKVIGFKQKIELLKKPYYYVMVSFGVSNKLNNGRDEWCLKEEEIEIEKAKE